MKSTLLVLIALISISTAADHSLFKTCKQSSFCVRCRGVNGSYEVVSGTLAVDTFTVTADIRNKENEQLFVFKLSGLQDNTFHFEMDEKTPLKPRYRVTEVLNQNPAFEVIDVSTSATEIHVKSLHNKAIIKMSPFKIDFYQDEVLSLTVNANNLLRFEHRRTKPTMPDEVPGTWEETFLDQIDSKPNGPEAVAVDFHFPESDVLFGIPEHTDNFALKRTVSDEPYRLYTLDVTGYEIDSRMPLYGTIPVIYGHGAKRTAGIFWHNSADTFVDVHNEKTAQFISEAGIIDVFVMLGPSPKDTFAQYTKLTGVGNLPQLFTLGYHQSRWNYMTQQELIEVVDKFDENDIPLDTVWLDIEYTDGKRYFTWNYTAFQNPLEMISYLKDSGRHLTYIIDPHIKMDEEYFFYEENRKQGFYVKNKDGSDYEGSCWPGMSSYVDYFNPEARRYYADQYLMTNFKENSVDTGIWNDMNEPTVFDVPEKTMPKDIVHYGDIEHRNVHNLYAHMQTKGTYDGLMRRGNGEYRPFILTRAFFSGTQRYSAVWTGDNTDQWSYLEASIKMCLSISVSGISFCGSDVGGFFGNPENELFVRWFQAAAFQPFFRSHANIESPRREPYLLPETERAIVREAIKKRYEYLPLWYTMFYEHEQQGLPIMTPMLTNYPKDPQMFKIDDQYMLSDKLLIRPVMAKGARTVDVHFPSVDGSATKGDIWYDTDDYKKYEAVGKTQIQVELMKIPVFQRGGTIIAKKEQARKSSVYMVDDPVSIFVALDEMSEAMGTLFVDDGQSYEYRKGNYLYLHFHMSGNNLTSSYVNPHANYTTSSRLKRIVIAGLKEMPKSMTLEFKNGETKDLVFVESNDGLDNPILSIENADVSLMDEWVITMNGAGQNLLCLSLLIVAALLHFGKFL